MCHMGTQIKQSESESITIIESLSNKAIEIISIAIKVI